MKDQQLERINALARQVRKSEAYPAVLGALAGGIAGALIALIISGMRAPRHADSGEVKSSARGGWSPREVLELLAVGTALAKQVREWYQERSKQ